MFTDRSWRQTHNKLPQIFEVTYKIKYFNLLNFVCLRWKIINKLTWQGLYCKWFKISCLYLNLWIMWSVLWILKCNSLRKSVFISTPRKHKVIELLYNILIWRPSCALLTNDRFIRWQNLISTCAIHTYKPGDKITK